jgi:dephospho-CoA kinase
MKLTTNQVKERIICEKPQIVVLCGKTCTGKSTFARELESLNYKHIEFDLIVRESVRNKFGAKDKEAFTVMAGLPQRNGKNLLKLQPKGLLIIC